MEDNIRYYTDGMRIIPKYKISLNKTTDEMFYIFCDRYKANGFYLGKINKSIKNYNTDDENVSDIWNIHTFDKNIIEDLIKIDSDNVLGYDCIKKVSSVEFDKLYNEIFNSNLIDNKSYEIINLTICKKYWRKSLKKLKELNTNGYMNYSSIKNRKDLLFYILENIIYYDYFNIKFYEIENIKKTDIVMFYYIILKYVYIKYKKNYYGICGLYVPLLKYHNDVYSGEPNAEKYNDYYTVPEFIKRRHSCYETYSVDGYNIYNFKKFINKFLHTYKDEGMYNHSTRIVKIEKTIKNIIYSFIYPKEKIKVSVEEYNELEKITRGDKYVQLKYKEFIKRNFIIIK